MKVLEIKYKIIILILLLVSTIYLIKTNEPRGKKERDIEPQEKLPKKTLTMEEAGYWIEKLEEKDIVLMDGEKIEEFNTKNFSRVDSLMDLKECKDKIEKEELIQLIKSISSIPEEERYNKNGDIMDKDYYNTLLSNLNLDSIKSDVEIQYGVSIDRTFIRTFPTYEPSYRKKEDTEFDRFQETAVYPWEPIIIYNKSKDGQWYFARMYNYVGWVPADKIAIGDKEEIFNYIDMEPFLVILDRQMTIIDKIFDMGVRIPLKEEKENSYIIFIPYKDENNRLEIVEWEINKFKELHLGYLPYTKENIILQAFKLMGETYGWGGLNNTRDCSAFMMDIYRSFGIKLPRNTLEQGSKSLGIEYDLNHNSTLEEKIALLEDIPPATSLYMPGHTMLYLGKEGDYYYIIHQFADYYEEKEGALEKISVMKTDISPVTIKTSSGKTYLESIYLAKEFIIE